MAEQAGLKNLLTTTTRLELRAVSEKDADLFFKAIRENQKHFSNYEFTQPQQETLAGVQMTLRDLQDHYQQNRGVYYGGWVDNQLIGMFSINGIDWQSMVADVGYWLVETAMGQGFALAGLNALMNYCMEGLDIQTVTAHVATSNLKSQKVLEKAGFQRHGLAWDGMRVRNRFVDQYLYYKLNDF